jgi:hypothetical protein
MAISELGYAPNVREERRQCEARTPEQREAALVQAPGAVEQTPPLIFRSDRDGGYREPRHDP